MNIYGYSFHSAFFKDKQPPQKQPQPINVRHSHSVVKYFSSSLDLSCFPAALTGGSAILASPGEIIEKMKLYEMNYFSSQTDVATKFNVCNKQLSYHGALAIESSCEVRATFLKTFFIIPIFLQ